MFQHCFRWNCYLLVCNGKIWTTNNHAFRWHISIGSSATGRNIEPNQTDTCRFVWPGCPMSCLDNGIFDYCHTYGMVRSSSFQSTSTALIKAFIHRTVPAEISATRVRQETFALARVSYYLALLVSIALAMHMMNPTKWNWAGASGFFYSNIFCGQKTKCR